MLKQIFSRARGYVKTNKKTSAGALIIILFAVFFLRGGSTVVNTKTVTVTRGPLESTVLVSGKVKSATDADLAFETNGTVVAVRKNPGDTVKKGDVILELDSRNDLAALEKARAVLKQKQAQYALVTGDTYTKETNELSIDGQSAKQVFLDSVSNGYTQIISTYNTLYTVLIVNLDPFFDNDLGISPSLTFDVSSQQKSIATYSNGSYGEQTVDMRLEEQVQYGRVREQIALGFMKDAITDGKESANTVFKNLTAIEEYLEQSQIFLITLSDALNNSSLDDATLATYKTTLNTARGAITTALDDTKKARQTIQDKNLAYKKSSSFIEQTNGTTIAADIIEQEAGVEEAEAGVKAAEAEYDHNFLRAPFDGILTTRDVDAGESVKAQTVVARVIEPAGLRIEADISEIDVPKLAAGAPAEIYFDAYGKDILFPAHIVSIDPGEKSIEGVPTYRTVLSLDTQDPRIRTGMTVNIEISAGKKDDVVQIPVRALVPKDGNRFVTLISNGTTTEQVVETGLRGNNGMIEIISGLEEGQTLQLP